MTWTNSAPGLVTADLHKWDDEAKKGKNLPLFLDREAYIVWQDLSDTDKGDPARVKETLEGAFSLTPAQVYRSFAQRRLHVEESVDG